MDIERAARLISALNSEFREIGLVEKLQNLHSLLSQISSAKSTNDLVNRFRTELAALEKSLRESKLNQLSPTEKDQLRQFQADSLYGTGLLRSLQRIFQSNNLFPDSAAEELAKVIERLTTAIASFQHLLSGLAAIGVQPEQFEPGTAAIGIFVPVPKHPAMLELVQETKGWERHLATIAEIAGKSRADVEVKRIATASWEFWLEAPLVVVNTISWLLGELNDILTNVALSQQLVRTLIKGGYRHETIEMINQENRAKIEQELAALAATGIERGAVPDINRRNELEGALLQAAKYFLHKKEEGAKVELHLEPPKAPELRPDASDEEREIYLVAAEESRSAIAVAKTLRDNSTRYSLPARVESIPGLLANQRNELED